MSDKKLHGQDLVLRMGIILLENGAEINRVFETMKRVSDKLGVKDFNAFVLTNSIFLNGTHGDNNFARVKFLPSYAINFKKICGVNQLSRDICKGDVTEDEIEDKLAEIESIKPSHLIKRTLACAVGCGAFCYMAGGALLDCVAAMIIGLVLELFLDYTQNHKVSKFIITLIASGISALLAVILMEIGIGVGLGMIITGAIIRLVPGIALTMSISDFFNSDFLSGTIRMVDAVMTGGCIGIGVGAVISIFNMITGSVLL